MTSIIPSISAAILILLGKGRVVPLGNKLLSVKPLVLTGVISYSLYLWHWPIIAYVNYLGIAINFWGGFLIVIITFILSLLTYKLVEIPFRYKFKFNLIISFMLFIVIPALLAMTFLYASKTIQHFAYNRITKTQYDQANTYYGVLKQKFGCMDKIDNKEDGHVLPSEKLCIIGDLSSKKPEVLIFGDSHAMADVGMLNVFLKNAQLSAYVVTQSGSPFILGAGITDWRDNQPVESSKKMAKLIKEKQYKYVILAGFWNYYPSLPSKEIKNPKPFEVFENGFINAINFIVQNHSTPVIIFDNPSTMSLKRYCGLSKIQVRPCYNPKEQALKQQENTNKILNRIKSKFPSAIFINPNKIICNDDNCYLSHDGIPFYMSDGDNSHLSHAGSEIIGKLYLTKFGNPFVSE